jgi:hypothetical protein
VKLLNRAAAELFLSAQGIKPKSETDKVLSGFDFDQPVHEHQLWPGDILYQLIRLPSARDPYPATGSWFGLAGITASGVAVNDGLSGRRLASFKVVAAFTALEGIAAKFNISRASGIGGRGGMTQIFIPGRLLWHLQSYEPAERWPEDPGRSRR